MYSLSTFIKKQGEVKKITSSWKELLFEDLLFSSLIKTNF